MSRVPGYNAKRLCERSTVFGCGPERVFCLGDAALILSGSIDFWFRNAIVSRLRPRGLWNSIGDGGQWQADEAWSNEGETTLHGRKRVSSGLAS